MVVELVGTWQIFAGGICGGLLAEFLRWYGLKDSSNLAVFQKSMFYWILTIGMIIVGGVWTVITCPAKPDIFLALSLGASAPAMITAAIYAGTTPAKTGGRSTAGPTLNFLAGRS